MGDARPDHASVDSWVLQRMEVSLASSNVLCIERIALSPMKGQLMKTPKIVRQIEVWPIGRLIPYANNPLTHPDEQIAQICISIQEHGMVNPILVDKYGNVIAGHGRILAAQLLGLTELPVIVLDHLTPAQARALRGSVSPARPRPLRSSAG